MRTSAAWPERQLANMLPLLASAAVEGERRILACLAKPEVPPPPPSEPHGEWVTAREIGQWGMWPTAGGVLDEAMSAWPVASEDCWKLGEPREASGGLPNGWRQVAGREMRMPAVEWRCAAGTGPQILAAEWRPQNLESQEVDGRGLARRTAVGHAGRAEVAA